MNKVAWVLALCAVTIAATPVHASTVLPLDLDSLTAGAQDVAHVRCLGSTVVADPVVGVATVTTFTVLDRAKGNPDGVISLRQPGGERNGLAVDFHTPKFNPGDEYVLFVPQASKFGFASPVGLSQGVFGVAQRDGRRDVGVGRDFAKLLARTDAAQVPPGIASRMRGTAAAASPVDLTEFMQVVRMKAARQ